MSVYHSLHMYIYEQKFYAEVGSSFFSHQNFLAKNTQRIAQVSHDNVNAILVKQEHRPRVLDARLFRIWY
jgi:hypothetical protein